MPAPLPLDSHKRRRELTHEWICAGSLSAAFVLLTIVSWRTWPDLLVDFGQELYVPWRLSVGDVLYRDVAWVTGPLSQYFNALLFRLFGVSLTTLIAVNLMLLAGVVAMLYFIFRQCGTRWSATYAGLFFLAVFAFGQYSLIGNYNYVCPYRHDITHGLILGLVNLLCLAKFGSTRRMAWLAASGIALGLLFLTKIEMTLAACLTTAAALPVFAFQTVKLARDDAPAPSTTATSNVMPRLRNVVYWSGIVAAAAVLPIAIAVSALAGSLGWTDSLRQTFTQYRIALSPELSTSTGFYRAVAGSDRPAESFIEMLLMTVIVLAAVITGYVAEHILGRLKRDHIWAPVSGLTVAFCGMVLVSFPDWQAVPTCLPLLLVPVIVFTLRNALRDSDASTTMLLLMAIYGLGLLPKMLLNVAWDHYGFVLAMPGTLVLIHVALHTIPVRLQGQGRTGRCFQAIALGLLTACALTLALSWIRIDKAKRAPIGNKGDLYYAEPRQDSRTLPTMNALDYLRKHLQADETLIVFPNGVMFNYLLRSRNPTPYIMFNPWESDVHGGENRIADTVIAAAPDYAVVVTMDMSLHGRGNFGSPEFGWRISQFLVERYDVVFQDVAQGGVAGEFAAVIFKRRP
ncbi:MAG: 4-amino-4-deoxy-L-arabinose transferase and related glycosyltransferase of family [Planctomycetaceae bacterium]|nr:4-amino-4-deoxy-L-arabinose transferase and related glycosyltransferase of family [Planctomycetaceae bacterium]